MQIITKHCNVSYNSSEFIIFPNDVDPGHKPGTIEWGSFKNPIESKLEWGTIGSEQYESDTEWGDIGTKSDEEFKFVLGYFYSDNNIIELDIFHIIHVSEFLLEHCTIEDQTYEKVYVKISLIQNTKNIKIIFRHDNPKGNIIYSFKDELVNIKEDF